MDSSGPGSPSYDGFVKSQEHLLQPKPENPQPTTVPPPSGQLAGCSGKRQIFSLIGLPCRGKAFLAEKLWRYLSFFHGVKCQTFDIAQAEYADDEALFRAVAGFLESDLASPRRPKWGSEQPTSLGVGPRHSNDGDEECYQMGERSTDITWGRRTSIGAVKTNVDPGGVAILYSSNELATYSKTWSGSSKEARWKMQKKIDTLTTHTSLLFIEVIVTDPGLMHSFILQRQQQRQQQQHSDVKLLASQVEDRIREYARLYVTIQGDGSEDDLTYMKLMNYGDRILTNKVRGLSLMRAVRFLSNIHPRQHTIYLSRNGESTYHVLEKIGGNPGLSPEGEKYALWLGKWVPQNVYPAGPDGKQQPCRLWTSSLKRSIDTARHIPHPVITGKDGLMWEQTSHRVYRSLDEIFAGEYEGMTYAEIEAVAADEATLRRKDKLGYRYPRGESYLDLIARLDSLANEFESYDEPLFIVSHQATLRMVYAYLMGIDRNEAPTLEIPIHTVIKIQYDGFGFGSSRHEERFSFNAGDEIVADEGQTCLQHSATMRD